MGKFQEVCIYLTNISMDVPTYFKEYEAGGFDVLEI